jgi:CAAX prenyl protease-like protein
MLAQMLAPYDRAAYVIKAGLVAAVLLSLRRYLVPATARTSWLAIAAGGAIGVAWIASDPGAGQPHAMGDWLVSLGPELALLWLAIRGIGTIVLVPIAEELAFRGYLYRRFISRDFESVAAMHLSWLGLIMSSVLFGLLHERWLAAGLAGAIFALVMIRTGRVRDAVIAHAIANGMIFAWAILFRQWSLL